MSSKVFSYRCFWNSVETILLLLNHGSDIKQQGRGKFFCDHLDRPSEFYLRSSQSASNCKNEFTLLHRFVVVPVFSYNYIPLILLSSLSVVGCVCVCVFVSVSCAEYTEGPDNNCVASSLTGSYLLCKLRIFGAPCLGWYTHEQK
jgi:hypothetical protein